MKLTQQQLLEKGYRKYRGQDVDIYFNLEMCQHAGICTMTLPNVFDVNRKPWLMPDADTKENVADMIHKCPSGALQYIFKENDLYFEVLDNRAVAICEQEEVGELEFKQDGKQLILNRPSISEKMRGQLIGEQIVAYLVSHAKDNQLELVSDDAFVQSELEKN